MSSIHDFQMRVADWMQRCFVRKGSMTPAQRSFRFVEEALELAQAMGTSRAEVEQLVEYVYSRPVGQPLQEIGGTIVTLAGVATSLDISLQLAAISEMNRCEMNINAIRQKDLAKPERAGALPS